MPREMSQAERDARRQFGAELNEFLGLKKQALTGLPLARFVGKHSVLVRKAPSRSTLMRVLQGNDGSPDFTYALAIVDAVIREENKKVDLQAADEAADSAVAQWLERWLELGLPAPGIPVPHSAEAILAWLAEWKRIGLPPVPDPEPDDVPDFAPDPEPDPVPDFVPDPDPEPEPVPDFVPDPDPEPEPVPDPEPEPVKKWRRWVVAAAVLSLLGLLVWTLTDPNTNSPSSDAQPRTSPVVSIKASGSAKGSPSTGTAKPSSSATPSGASSGPSSGGVINSSPSAVVNPTGQSTPTPTPQPTTPSPTPSQTTGPGATKPFPATVAWTDDGSPGGTDVYIYDSPNLGHTEKGGFPLGASLQVVCQVTSNDSITVGPSYSGPKPPPSNRWYQITYQQRWAPAVYVNTNGASIPACS